MLIKAEGPLVVILEAGMVVPVFALSLLMRKQHGR